MVRPSQVCSERANEGVSSDVVYLSAICQNCLEIISTQIFKCDGISEMPSMYLLTQHGVLQWEREAI